MIVMFVLEVGRINLESFIFYLQIWYKNMSCKGVSFFKFLYEFNEKEFEI